MYFFDYRSTAEAFEDLKRANLLNGQDKNAVGYQERVRQSIVNYQSVRMIADMEKIANKRMRAVRKRDLGEFCWILFKSLLIFNSI